MAFEKKYDVCIIGAGHAGCEAALSASRMGADTLLITISIDNIALMSCNPAIGGLGKGNLVKDIDALGGEMAKNIDASGIQFRILNKKKGPAVQSSRAQADKFLYANRMRSLIMSAPTLDVKQDIVSDIIVNHGEVAGVETVCGQIFYARKVVICGGTFIGGEIYIGSTKTSAGRMYEPAALALSDSLKKIGLVPVRLKTDTPARIHIDSINFDGLEAHESDKDIVPFSMETKEILLPQIKCYGTKTNEATHKIIRDNLGRSQFYNGSITGIGPRYCPSIEDKVTKFPEKPGHNIILEPEGLTSKEVHANGFSTSMPADVQLAAYRTVKGLENCVFTRPGYAIQYDVFQPTGLYHTYESKSVKGLYIAGQPNGTSGYEEAASQGLLAAINAVLALDNQDPFVLQRDESYLGVLTDDLTLKGVEEPYRMFSSRGEYRLLTREDNAESRLIKYGYKFGLISEERYDRFQNDESLIKAEIERLKTSLVKQTPENMGILTSLGSNISKSTYALNLLVRPEISYADICAMVGGGLRKQLADRLETEIKYAGYIEKQKKELDKLKNFDDRKIPSNFSYDNLPGLRFEHSERLNKIRPTTLGEAMRIPGLTMAAIGVLDIEISKFNVSRETSD